MYQKKHGIEKTRAGISGEPLTFLGPNKEGASAGRAAQRLTAFRARANLKVTLGSIGYTAMASSAVALQSLLQLYVHCL
jgi:hypothetical protein